MDLNSFLLIMTGVSFEVLGQVAFKRGAVDVARSTGARGVLRYWRALALNRWMHLGLILQIVALLIWIAALIAVPLSIAFPLASLSYCGAAICGRFCLGEKLGLRSVGAIALITIGAALVLSR
jgi:undecaprenyl phosphate-alpha-L-ara4N flippase subunit ArnE